ncbi:MAG: hypothetical protein MR210_06720 [Erysipelotrichaceae bacterium]|nr:hypothetical protein [Erysipelotrichaceae bacterium]MDY5252841.1 hypothetical protein [Erysipelotrichaceae bacterium]
MFEWAKGNAFSLVVTIYNNNFTLNNCAAQHFQNSKWCMIGIDKLNRKVAIKPVTKQQIDLNLFPLENLHKVFMGKGYARISNKAIINEIAELLQQECNGQKFSCEYDQQEEMLIIDLAHQL